MASDLSLQGFQGVIPELDLVEAQDQITHDLNLDDDLDDESFLGKTFELKSLLYYYLVEKPIHIISAFQ
jgi:hypothetical protein